jgi:hypothetical protein
MSCGWIPYREAMSRSIFKVSVVPEVCWSVATSRNSGSDLSLSRILDDQAFSSSKLASWTVYWNCVLEKRAAHGHVLRRLQVDFEARDLRQLRPQPRDHLKDVNVAFVARLQGDEHAPVVLRGVAEFRCRAPSPSCRRRIGHDDCAGSLLQLVHFGNETSCPASVVPNRMPVSCCGKNPLGMTTNR